jgi:hypothetical protein
MEKEGEEMSESVVDAMTGLYEGFIMSIMCDCERYEVALSLVLGHAAMTATYPCLQDVPLSYFMKLYMKSYARKKVDEYNERYGG